MFGMRVIGSQKFERRKAHEFEIAEAILAWRLPLAIAGALILPLGRGTLAHSVDEGEEGRLQGTWHLTVTLHNCQTGAPLLTFPSLLTFASGQTLVEVTLQSRVHAWAADTRPRDLSRTEGHTFSATSDAFILFPSASTPPGFRRGVQRITQTIQVNGDNFVANASTQFFDANGTQYDAGCAHRRWPALSGSGP